MPDSIVRTRFAPSPTGMLHIGAVRTALYAWLYARQQKGQFILRIEDTDKAREVAGAEANIKESLTWLGLKWDEEYKQSERLKLYQRYAKQLYEAGLAYADPYAKEEVEKFRADAKAKKRAFLFRDYRPDDPPVWKLGQPLRFKVANIKSCHWQDVVRGELSAGEEALDDIVLLKADGFPTYNFAHIVDDHLTKITHVVRGEEFIASVPKFLSIYEALGWNPPAQVTVPPIISSGGTKKLSKREGAQSILEYRDQGYLPEALLSYLALLGWHPGSNQEIFNLDELIKSFSLNRVQKSSAKFDADRLDWINSQFIKSDKLVPLKKLLSLSEVFWPADAKLEADQKAKILELERERIKTLGELKDLPDYFYKAPKPVKSLRLLKAGSEDMNFASWIQTVITTIKKTDLNQAALETSLRELVANQSGEPKTLFSVLRIALTDSDHSPPIWDLVYVLGKSESLRRLETALSLL